MKCPKLRIQNPIHSLSLALQRVGYESHTRALNTDGIK